MNKLLFSLLLVTTNALALDLTLFIKPAPRGMDWTTPNTLVWSGMKNILSFDKYPMGHVFARMNCADKAQTYSMENKKFDYINQSLFESRGLGLLFHSFEGKLEVDNGHEGDLQKLIDEGEVSFVKFTLNPGQCQRLGKYIQEYLEKNVDRYYGLANRPLYGEGGGSSAFSASLVEVLDFMSDELRAAWTTSVLVPYEFSGAPLTDNKVNGLKVLFQAKNWAQGSEPQRQLIFWDPEKMHKWAMESRETVEMKKAHDGKAHGVVIDKSYLPALSGPYWKQNKDPQYHQGISTRPNNGADDKK